MFTLAIFLLIWSFFTTVAAILYTIYLIIKHIIKKRDF